MYHRTLDPFVTLAAAAAVTSTIELVSDGGFVFGVRAGWNLEEMRNYGTDPKT